MKERMVTRTIKTTIYNTLCMDIETAETVIKDYTITGEIEDSKALKLLQNWYNTENFKVVAIKNATASETLYGMPETMFIQLADKIVR